MYEFYIYCDFVSFLIRNFESFEDLISMIKRLTGKIIFLPGDALITSKRLLGMSFIYIMILFPSLLGILSPSRISRIFRTH